GITHPDGRTRFFGTAEVSDPGDNCESAADGRLAREAEKLDRAGIVRRSGQGRGRGARPNLPNAWQSRLDGLQPAERGALPILFRGERIDGKPQDRRPAGGSGNHRSDQAAALPRPAAKSKVD